MNKISVVIITYNEQENIERCLLSVIDVADEIIVLDSFSTDKTAEICGNYHVNFVQHKFEGYSEQKNKAISMATYDYILSLDADEFLSENLKQAILKEKQNFEYDGYFFERLNYFCEKAIRHGDWYPDKKIRLWNKHKGRWDGKKIHETVSMDSRSAIGTLSGNLEHYSFHSVSQHITQINKFSELKAQNDFETKKRASILKLLFKPIFKFTKIYLLKLGFLDGFYGFVIAYNSAYFDFLRIVKLKEKYKKHNK